MVEKKVARDANDDLERQISQLREVEADLRRARNEWASLFYRAPVGMIRIAPDGEILQANRAALRIWEIRKKEFVGMNIREFLDRQIVAWAEETLRQGQRIENQEVRIQRPDGSTRHLLISANAFREKDEIRYFVATTIDITKWIQTAQHLQQVRRWSHCLFWYAVVREDQARNHRWDLHLVDEESAQQFIPLEVPNGLNYVQSWYMSRPEEDSRRMRDFSHQELEANQSYSQTFRCIDRNGQVHYLLEDVRVEPRPNDPETGLRRWQAFGVCLDITDRVLAEERLRRVTNQVPCILWEADVRHDWQWETRLLNEEAAQRILSLHVPPGSTYMVAFWENRTSEDQTRVEQYARAKIRAGESYGQDFRCYAYDGQEHWLREEVNVEEVKEGHFRLFGSTWDITERKQAENKLRFISEASNVLASSIDYEETLRHVAYLALPGFADWCTVDLVTEDGSLQHVAIAHTDPSKVGLVLRMRERYPFRPDVAHGTLETLQTGELQLVTHVDDAVRQAFAQDDEHLQLLREIGDVSFIRVPLQAHGRTLGVTSFSYAESGRHYTADDLVLAEEIARRAAVAIDNAQHYQEAQEEIRVRKRIEEQLREVEDKKWEFYRDTLYAASGNKVILVRRLDEIPSLGSLILERDFSRVSPEIIKTLRDLVAGEASRLGMGSDRVEDLRLATGETVTNAVEHAESHASQPEDQCSLSVYLISEDDRPDSLVVRVRDKGKGIVEGRIPRSVLEAGGTSKLGEGGRGWQLTQALCDLIWLFTQPGEGLMVQFKLDFKPDPVASLMRGFKDLTVLA